MTARAFPLVRFATQTNCAASPTVACGPSVPVMGIVRQVNAATPLPIPVWRTSAVVTQTSFPSWPVQTGRAAMLKATHAVKLRRGSALEQPRNKTAASLNSVTMKSTDAVSSVSTTPNALEKEVLSTARVVVNAPKVSVVLPTPKAIQPAVGIKVPTATSLPAVVLAVADA